MIRDDRQVIRAVGSVDDRRRWWLLRRPAGVFIHVEETRTDAIYVLNADGVEEALIAEGWWETTHVSGMFDSAAAAQADAVATLPWLGAVLEGVAPDRR